MTQHTPNWLVGFSVKLCSMLYLSYLYLSYLFLSYLYLSYLYLSYMCLSYLYLSYPSIAPPPPLHPIPPCLCPTICPSPRFQCTQPDAGRKLPRGGNERTQTQDATARRHDGDVRTASRRKHDRGSRDRGLRHKLPSPGFTAAASVANRSP